jgi:hypothetical protein
MSAENPSTTNIILPSSFMGSQAWSSSQVSDALALSGALGPPSIFIIMTTNPKWLEIVSQLDPDQTVSDIPDVVCRIFNTRLKIALHAIEIIFGDTVYLVKVIEFQKCGLLHCHMILKVKLKLCI